MNNTITLQSVVNLASTHADLLPLTGVGGYINEPALSLCNDAISELLTSSNNWKFNRVEMPMFVTCPNKQDYQFGGAVAFSLGSTSQGWAIGLSSNSAITVTTGVVTVTTLENHRFAVGDTIYMQNNINPNYNSVFTDTGAATSWTGGWVITAIGAKTFTFAKTTGQNNADVTGAPGITNFGWLTDASLVEMNNNSSPQNVRTDVTTFRELPVTSRVANPDKFAVMADNGDGTLKIRCQWVPGSTTWGVNLVYQAQQQIKVSLNDDWAPFPDSYSSLYRQALLYRMWRYLNSPTANAEYAKLQQEIQKAQGSDDAEETSVQIVPDQPLMDSDYGWW